MRTVVANMWTGAALVRRPGFTPSDVDGMSDDQVVTHLRALREPLALTAGERRARLRAYPTQGDLDAIASELTAANDGVKPVVRVLDTFAFLGRP